MFGATLSRTHSESNPISSAVAYSAPGQLPVVAGLQVPLASGSRPMTRSVVGSRRTSSSLGASSTIQIDPNAERTSIRRPPTSMRVTAPVVRSIRLNPHFCGNQQAYGRSKPLATQIAAASTVTPPQVPVGLAFVSLSRSSPYRSR